MRTRLIISGIAALSLTSSFTLANDFVVISELMNDPPGDVGDVLEEYIELRGTPNLNLSDCWLIGMENENGSATGTVGSIEFLIDLNGRSIGTNGFLTLRQNGSPYTRIAPGTRDLVNTIGLGYGSNPDSSIGAEDENGDGISENSGATYMLIRRVPSAAVPNPNVPFIGLDLDGGNNGLDYAFGNAIGEGRPGWKILDSVGYFAEPSDADGGRLLAKVNYGPEFIPNNEPLFEPGAQYNKNDFQEIEYVGRYGSSVTSTLEDWVAANVTNNPVSGFTNENLATDGYRISGPHAEPLQPGEISRSGQNGIAPEGTIIMSLGRPNWPVPDGDLSQNLKVDQTDLDILLNNWQDYQPELLGYWLEGDSSGDATVGQADLDFVLDHWLLPTDPEFTDADMGFLTGDTNIDGAVNFDDLLTLAQNYGQLERGYRKGDFNHDSIVDFDDLLSLAQRYGTNWLSGESPQTFGEREIELLTAFAIVPEPFSLLPAFLLIVANPRQRRIP